MGLHMIHMFLVAVLCRSLSTAAPVSDNPVVSVRSPVSAQRSHTTVLPCWFSPPQILEGLEVRWYRHDHFDTPIILYQSQKLDASKEASYTGRVSFGVKEGELKTGDVSLKLMNVTIADAGDYMCYVSNDKGYDRGRVSLSVIEMGTSPSLSVMWKEVNLVNVSCESAGWYPQPQLQWSDQKQSLDPGNVVYHSDSSGLVSVHSWLLVSSSSEVSCSVGLPDGKGMVARVHLGNPSQPAEQKSGSSVAGWVAFTLLLIAMLAFLGLLYFRKRVPFFRKKSQNDQVNGDEVTPLLNKAPLTEAAKYYVNVTLDEVGNPYLKIKDCKVRDTDGIKFPEGEKVPCITAIKGTSGFSSGKHYWEVSLGNPKLGLKQSWWIGVTSATVFPLQNNVPLSNGFWFLSSSPDRADSFQFNTEPKVFLPVRSRPQTVGVFLNYDSGELSFYNVEDKSVIGSLTATFTGEVFPLFNPGIDDKAPMEILHHKPVQDECSDVNSVESTTQEAAS